MVKDGLLTLPSAAAVSSILGKAGVKVGTPDKSLHPVFAWVKRLAQGHCTLLLPDPGFSGGAPLSNGSDS